MTYRIESRKVAGVVKEANAALMGHDFNPVEVIVGLSELLGRIIVEVGTTRVQMDELQEVVNSHIGRTVQIGSHATNKSPIAQA